MPEDFLRLRLRHRLGPLHLDVGFALRAPWTILFGASGSGKSTILRAIQGLLRPDEAEIVLRGQTLTGVNDFLAPHKRPIRYAAQQPGLFPHLSVRDNLLWGADTKAPLSEVLRVFQIDSLAEARPERLSGGERQRVGVARAVLSAAALPGSLLLLDEPFSGLDLTLRDTLVLSLRDWLAERAIPTLSVTHDIAEAFLLDATVLRLHAGRVLAEGTPAEVLAAEREQLLRHLRSC